MSVWFALLAIFIGQPSPARAENIDDPDQQRAVIPSPRSILGFTPGDDRTIADWKQITNYFAQLDQASDRVQVSFGRLQSVHADRAVYVHVNEAGVDGQPFKVECARASRGVLFLAFEQARDAPALDEHARAFGDARREHEPRAAQE